MSDVALHTERLDDGLLFLDQQGINLAALLSTEPLVQQLPELAVDPAQFASVLLLGSTGPSLWSRVCELGLLSHPDPVDEHSRRTVETFCRQFLGINDDQIEIEHEVAWPDVLAHKVPISGLGAYAGWHHPSPLGLGIHPVHGLWFAYRSVILLKPSWPERRLDTASNPCNTCTAKPCVTACPVGALGDTVGLDLNRCFDERQRPGAICGQLCLARTACPVGSASRYSAPQVEHHHRFAMLGWKKYFQKD